jgi:hypothetical protein
LIPNIALISGLLAGLGLGWMLALATRRPTIRLQPSSSEAVRSTPSGQQSITASTHGANGHESFVTYRLVSDDAIIRGEGTLDLPAIITPTQPTLLFLELPVSASDAHRSFHVALRPLRQKAEVLSESFLNAKTTSSGTAVTFPVPSVLMKENMDYVIDLRYRGGNGNLEELSTYTFHAAKPN